MKFENRINLFVLLLVILLAIPGGYKLFKKQLDPESKQMFLLPPPVQRTVAYNAPVPVPPTIRRVVPARTAAWVASLVQGRTSAGSVAMHGWPTPGLEPLASRFQAFQVAAITPTPTGLKLGVIVWYDGAPLDPKAYQMSADFPGASAELSPASAESLAVPEAVRGELQDNNYIDPPKRVAWLSFDVARPARATSAEPLGFRLTFGADGEAVQDAVVVAAEAPAEPAVPPVGFPAAGGG